MASAENHSGDFGVFSIHGLGKNVHLFIQLSTKQVHFREFGYNAQYLNGGEGKIRPQMGQADIVLLLDLRFKLEIFSWKTFTGIITSFIESS